MKLKGIGAAEGIAVAKLWRMETVDLSVEHLTDRDPEKESVRFADAQHKATDELTALYEEALTKDADAAMIFDIHRMMLEDLDFCEGVSGLVASGCNAEWAVKQTGDMLHDMFEARSRGTGTLTSLRQSLESHYMALAAEASRLAGGKMIVLEEFLQSLK